MVKYLPVSILVLSAAALISPEATCAPPTEIRGARIMLVDVCEKCAEEIGDIQVAEAPLPGKTRVVRRAEVLRALEREGVSLENGKLPKRVKVRRVSREAAQKEVTARVMEAVRGVLPADMVIISHGKIGKITVPKGEYTVEAQWNGRELFSRRTSVKVTFEQEGIAFKELRLPIKVAVEMLVPVAAADLEAGRVLRRGDIELRRVRLDGRSDRFAIEAKKVVGTKLKTSAKEGEPFVASKLESVPVVFRGDRIDVNMSVGSIKVRTRGRALQEGAVGDRIRVEVASLSKLLWVQLDSPGSGSVSQ